MTMVIMTILLLFPNGDFQVTEVDERYWSLEHCVTAAEEAVPLLFREIPHVEEIRYECQEVRQ